MNLLGSGERRARRIVGRRSGGWCEVCDRAGATEWHHRKNRSQGGRWCPANGLHVCSECHRYITTHPEAARQQGWAVPRESDPATAPVWLGRHGWARLSTAGDITPTDLRRRASWPW